MKWWKAFLKKRRQSDRVKIQTICLLLGIVFLCDFVYRSASLIQFFRTPQEYVLTGTSGEVTDGQISTLREQDHVKCVSRQQETSVTFFGKEKSMTVTCFMLTEEYLTNGYGIPKGSGAQNFYLNQTAWEQLLETEESADAETADGQEEAQKHSKTTELRVKYKVEGEDPGGIMKSSPGGSAAETLSGGSTAEGSDGNTMGMQTKESNGGNSGSAVQSTARASAVEGLPDSEAYAVMKGNSAELSGTGEVRVLFDGYDMDGLNQKHLTGLGFTVENSGEIERAELEQEMLVLRIKYDALLVVILLLLALKGSLS